MRKGGLVRLGRFFRGTALVLVAGVLSPPGVQAQRAQDSAIAAAQDAFGTSIGRENVGIYTADNVRGFNPIQAGNVRVEGMSFDQQWNPNFRLSAGSAIHVGISALAYPLPAPTGIVDYRLRIPGDRTQLSFGTGYGPYQKSFVELDLQTPVVKDKLSIGGGAALSHDSFPFGAGGRYINTALLARWRPLESAEIVPFIGWTWRDGEGVNPQIYLGAPVLPPHIKRRRYYGQPWAQIDGEGANYGAIGRFDLAPGWLLRTGLFRSLQLTDNSFTDLLVNALPSGSADRYVYADPPQRYGSVSGEARLTRLLVEGNRRHNLHVTVKGRLVNRLYAGSDIEYLGPTRIATYQPVPMPSFVFTERTRDRARQGTAGFGYEGTWRGVGELSFGVQKTSYRLTVDKPGVPGSVSRAKPWLYSSNAAVFLGTDLAFYAGTARGLEESGVASDTATNRGEAQPASITRQVDAGLRYRILPGLSAVAGLFEVRKPYFNLNAARRFTRVGKLRHKGAELSLSGIAASGLSVNAGVILMKARAQIEAVADQAILGSKLAGRLPRYGRYTAEYGPADWHGFSVDLEFFDFGHRPGSLDGKLTVPARRFITAGARYRFQIAGAPAMLRFQAANLTDKFGWQVNQAGGYTVNDARRYSLALTVDY